MVILCKCFECKHFHHKDYSDFKVEYTCNAFPLRIPGWNLLYSNSKICNKGIGYEPNPALSFAKSDYGLEDDIYADWPQGVIMMGLTEEAAAELEKTIQVKIWR